MLLLHGVNRSPPGTGGRYVCVVIEGIMPAGHVCVRQQHQSAPPRGSE